MNKNEKWARRKYITNDEAQRLQKRAHMTHKIECYKVKTGEDTGCNPIYTLRCFCNTSVCTQQNKKIAHTQNDDSYDDIIKELDKKLYGNIL